MADLIRVHTIQSPGALEWANQHGYLTGSPEHLWPVELKRSDPDTDWSQIETAYDWIKEEMARHLPDYSGDWPIWCRLRPYDLRSVRHFWSDDLRVFILVTAQVPEKRVLPYSCDGWHCVLNRSPVLTESEWEEEWDPARGWKEWPADQLKATWPRIFDAAYGELDEAVVDRIYLEEVKTVKAFRTFRESAATSKGGRSN